MRRFVAMAVAGAIAMSPVASAVSVDCAAMRARALPNCCCKPATPENARLTCCTTNPGASSITPSPRQHTEGPQVTPPTLALVTLVHPNDGVHGLAGALTRALPASTASPPPLPLRI